MSRLYFSSVSGEAELAGPERHWLSHLARQHGAAAWDLGRSSRLERCQQIMAMIPEPEAGLYGANYLHKYLRAAEAADKALHTEPRGRYDPEPLHRLVESLAMSISGASVSETEFVVGENKLGCANVVLNTALAVGSDPIRFAAKLAGWDFCLIEGSERSWAAGIIDAGLAGGMFRRSLGPRDDMGWPRLAEFLRSNDTDAVVTHHSTGDSFPDQYIADWTAPELPADWRPAWALDSDKGRAEWDEMDPEKQASTRNDHQSDQWYELPDSEQWSLALAGLRSSRPWCRLAPDTLGAITFGPGVTIYDLLAPERDERVATAVAAEVPS